MSSEGYNNHYKVPYHVEIAFSKSSNIYKNYLPRGTQNQTRCYERQAGYSEFFPGKTVGTFRFAEMSTLHHHAYMSHHLKVSRDLC